MVHKITYLMRLYSTPLCLVVNNDQIGIRLVPIALKKTWENKATKHIQVLRVEDKRHVSMVVFFVTNGCLCPRQVTFTSTMQTCLAPSNEGKIKCIKFGWHLTFSENHWSTLQTTKDFVSKILLIYLSNQIQQLNLQKKLKTCMVDQLLECSQE